MSYLSCLNGENDFSRSVEILWSKGLVVKQYDDLGLYLVIYDKSNCDMTDPDIRKCRGLILEKDTNKVVCLPPTKSIKIEDFTQNINITGINHSNIIYEEFLDGTMINLFYYRDSWHISTRSCIGANCRWFSKKRFDQMFEESHNFDLEKFNKELTYTFVLQHNENRIVKNYSENDLTLVQVMNNITLLPESVESVRDNGIEINIRKTYSFDNILDAYASIENMSYDIQGYVVRVNESNNVRSKMRNPKYNFVRYLRGNTRNLKYLFLDLRANNYLNSYLEYFPENMEIFDKFTQEFYATTRSLFDYYQKFRVRKEIQLENVPYEFRPLCYELHGSYIKNKTVITFAEVKIYMNNLPPARQLFIMNYKKRDECKSVEQTNSE